VDQPACREHFATLLSQESGALDTLAGLLEREHGLLVSNDVTALEAAMAERQSCVGALLRLATHPTLPASIACWRGVILTARSNPAGQIAPRAAPAVAISTIATAHS
jgi:hypothetical protein